MSFLAPLRLLLLVLPLLLLVAYVLLQRRRSRTAVRFSSVDLLASVAPRHSGWQRHVAPALTLLTLGTLIVAFAQPTLEMRTPKERATVMLTLDTSASMTADDVSPSRLAAAQDAARSFVEDLPEGVQVGLVAYDQNARLLVAPTTDRAPLVSAIDNLEVGRGTATASGIELALQTIQGLPAGESGKPAPAAIVLLSDGTPTIGIGDMSPEDSADQAAQEAKDATVPIDTIAFGTNNGVVVVQGREIPVPYDPEAMARIAEQTSGQTFTAESAGELTTVYEQIGRDVAYDKQTVEVTVLFVGIALLLGVLAAAAALVWGQRIA